LDHRITKVIRNKRFKIKKGFGVKMKKFLRFYILVIIFLVSNFSAMAYTRKDLENIQNGSSVANLILSLPFIISDNPSESTFNMSLPAVIPEGLLESALESSNLIAIVTVLSKRLRLYANPEFAKKVGIPHPVLLSILTLIIYKIIMKKYPTQKNRIKRRVIRAIVMATMKAFLQSSVEEDQSASKFLGNFLSALVAHSLGEYIGEKIIQGAEDEEIMPVR
jgi:hypothetical protein